MTRSEISESTSVNGNNATTSKRLFDDATGHQQAVKLFDEGIPLNVPYSETRRKVEELYPTMPDHRGQTTDAYLRLIAVEQARGSATNGSGQSEYATDIKDLAKITMQHWARLDKDNDGTITTGDINRLLADSKITGLDRAILQYISKNSAAICEASNDAVGAERADKISLRDVYRYFGDVNPRPDMVTDAVMKMYFDDKQQKADEERIKTQSKEVKKADHNGDKNLSLDEFLKAKESSVRKEFNDIVTGSGKQLLANDIDASGSISFAEYENFATRDQVKSDAELRKSFAEKDNNGDGKISLSEMQESERKRLDWAFQTHLAQARISALNEFEYRDLDKDGKLSTREAMINLPVQAYDGATMAEPALPFDSPYSKMPGRNSGRPH